LDWVRARRDYERGLRGIRRRRKERRALPEDLRRLRDVGIALVVAVRRGARCHRGRRRRQYGIAAVHCATALWQRVEQSKDAVVVVDVVVNFAASFAGGRSRAAQREDTENNGQAH